MRCDLRPEVCEMPHEQPHPGLPVEGLVLYNLHGQPFTSSALWVMSIVTVAGAVYRYVYHCSHIAYLSPRAGK